MIICRSEGDFCLSFSNFSSCLISLFWTRLHFLISACTEKEGHFPAIPRGPGPTPAHLEVHPAHPGLLYLGTVELQGADDLGLQPLDLQGTCGSVKEAEKTAFVSSACTRGEHTQGPGTRSARPGSALKGSGHVLSLSKLVSPSVFWDIDYAPGCLMRHVQSLRRQHQAQNSGCRACSGNSLDGESQHGREMTSDLSLSCTQCSSEPQTASRCRLHGWK